VPLIPIAGFLAGSLLTLLLPIGLLISLTVWYVKFVRRVPGPEATGGTEGPDTAPGAEGAEGAEGPVPGGP
jgi:hypothetical protein